jgi:hypothetical protein
MTTKGNALSFEELSRALAAHAGPSRPRTRHARSRWSGRRTAWVAAALVLILAGAAYAAGFNPFAGISAADHPATSDDSLPAFLTAEIAQSNAMNKDMGHGELLPDSTRFVSQLPSGMRFYVIATSAGGLCLAEVRPPGSSNARAAISCGESLSANHPITLVSENPDGSTPISYGLAMDGVTSISFPAGGDETTVPVTDNVWAYEGAANLQTVIVHWDDGSNQTLTDGR